MKPITIIKLTPEETLARIANAQTYINRESQYNEPNVFLLPYSVSPVDQQRDHWRKLHTTLFTPEEFELWIQGIPGCSSCQRDFRQLIQNNPPRFDDWFRWTWEIHNEVNQKLGKQLIAWTDAIQLWGWSIKDIQTDGDTEDSS